MSEQDDALREMAANRGCKLVKSRRRKPGGDFGRYGLKDAKSGKELLGFGAEGLTATAEEIEDFLRGDTASSWKSSLRSSGPATAPAPPRRRREAKPTRTGRKRAWQAPEPARLEKPPARKTKPKEPEPAEPAKIREAKPADADAISRLLGELGYDVTPADVRRRLNELRKLDLAPLVAARGKELIGCLTLNMMTVLHRPRPVGRISALVVSEAERGGGIGTALVEAAEARLRKLGCGLVEVTSNMKRMRAHAFYVRLGYEKTSYRFAKQLQE